MKYLALVLALAACGGPLADFEATDVTPVAPSAKWVEWFNGAAACVGLDAPPSAPDWYLFDSMRHKGNDRGLRGLHSHGNIYIKRRVAYQADVVQHEAIHWLLYKYGLDPDPAHAGPWYDRCVEPDTARAPASEYGLAIR